MQSSARIFHAKPSTNMNTCSLTARRQTAFVSNKKQFALSHIGIIRGGASDDFDDDYSDSDEDFDFDGDGMFDFVAKKLKERGEMNADELFDGWIKVTLWESHKAWGSYEGPV